jgi:hypothetical protein
MKSDTKVIEEVPGKANQELISFLMKKENDYRFRGRVQVRMSQGEGQIYAQDGRIIHAQVQGLSGEPALFLMLLQAGARIWWYEEELAVPVTIERSLTELLVSLARLEDSGQTSYQAILALYPEAGQRRSSQHDYSHCYVILEASDAEFDGLNFRLNLGSHSLGRSEGCAVVVAHDSVSGCHAMLDFEKGSIRIRDHGSTNGTFVNGRLVKEETLGSGDWLRLGSISFRVTIKIERHLTEQTPEAEVMEEVERPSGLKRLTKALTGAL